MKNKQQRGLQISLYPLSSFQGVREERLINFLQNKGGTCPTFPGLGWGSCAGGPGSRGFEPHYFAVTPPALDTPESFAFPKV